MALIVRGSYRYGDSAEDIRTALAEPVHEVLPCNDFIDIVCDCGSTVFDMWLDEYYQEADFLCRSCDHGFHFHLTDNPSPYDGNPEASTEFVGCICEVAYQFRAEIVVGVALDKNGDIPRQVSIACRCVECGVTGTYADWDEVDISRDQVFANTRNVLRDE